MITLKNIASGELVNVSKTVVRDGKIFGKRVFGNKFYEKNSMLTKVGETEDGMPILSLVEGWEIATTERKPKEEKKEEKKERKPKTQPKEKKEEPKEEPKENEENESEEEKLAKEIAALLYERRKVSSGINVDEIEGIFAGLLAKAAQEAPRATKLALKNIKEKEEEKNEVYCDDFERILRDVRDGYYAYLYGPAGCGKSHTAEQIAKILGLQFYGQTTIQFAHDVKGFVDAGGNFQNTPFFKAFSGGGLYFQDEMDRSLAEALVVLNSALANGWFDFPGLGRVEMHPDFRFMGAGNTCMQGGDEQYVTGQVLDASTIDRFSTLYEVGYNHTVEMAIAKGNGELVEFVEDVRNAIKECGIQQVVSYRATKYLVNREDDMAHALKKCVFKTLGDDEVRMIVNKLRHQNNKWAKVAKSLI